MSDNKSIVYFSENMFDRKIYNKSEIRVTVRNLIKTINLLIPKGQVNTNIQDTIIHFGISDEHNYNNLSTYLGKSLWIQLKEAMSRVNENLVYSEYLDIAKYSKRYRELRSSDLSLITRPTLVDLFCGSGGLSLGLVQSGFRIIFANDIEKSALQTYSFNHPEIIGKNITMGGIEEIAHHIKDYVSESVDVLAGGPPCQGFSMANRQRIIDDPRNILYKYYVESVRNLKPKIFIMENVKEIGRASCRERV